VREHLRPKPRRPVLRAANVPPDLLRAYPDVLVELNAVAANVFVGQGRPGPGWDGWATRHVWLDEALALAGEA
jgi:hypothetical protein